MKIKRFLLVFLVLSVIVSCDTYIKIDPPNDADKTYPEECADYSCWMATASNMLAAAKYGTGNTFQEKAVEIYNEMIAEFGTCGGGWIDTALEWWLSSPNNIWPDNTYDQVSFHGHTSKVPYAEPDLPKTIGNLLRECNMLGVSISWVNASGYGAGGHAITAWGDNRSSSKLSSNPSKIYITDSDKEPASGTYSKYTYDSYTNPNPNGNNLGDGWYFDYSDNHPFIKHIAVLSPVEPPIIGKFPLQTAIGSYMIRQGVEKYATNKLYYKVGTDVGFYKYSTKLDWDTNTNPSITEDTSRKEIAVEWDVSENPVHYDKWVTITTMFLLPQKNSMFYYKDVHFSFHKEAPHLILPNISWSLITPRKEKATKLKNVRGGYITGEFEIVDTSNGSVVGKYRLMKQYNYDQDPENHKFSIKGPKGYLIRNINFGHNYGVLDKAKLWKEKKWITSVKEGKYYLDTEKPIEIDINWVGKLPYPDPGNMPEKGSKLFFNKK